MLDNVSLARVREIGVENNSFEEIDGELPATASDVPGLFAVPNLQLIPVGVEAVSDAADGDNVLVLDTSDIRLDRVFQNIRTEAGASYFVSFDLRNVDVNNLANSLRVKWNGEFAGSFRANADWQTFGSVVDADTDFSTLLFREANADSGSGLQIDNIKVFKIGSLAGDYQLDLNGVGSGIDSSLTYIENVETNLISDNLTLEFDNGNLLRSATIRVLNFEGTETLSANTTGTRIDASFDEGSGILRLVGRDSVENYRTVLRSLRYNDSSDTPVAEKNLVLSVTDGTLGSERAEITLNVLQVNDIPEVLQPAPVTAEFGQTLSIPIQATDPEMEALDFAFFEFSGDLEIFGTDFDGNEGFVNPTITESGNLEFTTFGYGSSNIRVAVTDPAATEQVFADFQINVPFVEPDQPLPGDFAPFSGQRQLSDVTPALRNGIYATAPEMSIDLALDYQAVIETEDGIIRFDLFENESPLTVNNFVNLAEDGFYDGLTFHRVLPDFVAQGGDPTGVGNGGPGYTFVDELDNGLEFDSAGILAMANSGPNTNGSQFFFTLVPDLNFSGDHTIFGEVIQGEDVLNQINLSSSGIPEVIQRVTIEIVS